MAIMIILLIIVLMIRLSSKGKAYREEKKFEAYRRRQEIIRQAKLEGKKLTPEQIAQQKRDALEMQYRRELEKEGYPDHLITVILPQLMNGDQNAKN
jgi:hypothetical protein